MTLLNREAIFARALPTADVDVAEWGGTVRVRMMTVAERNEFSRRADAKDPATGAWLVATLCVDEGGKPLFNEGDVARLEASATRPFDRVVEAILALNTVSEERLAQAEKS